MSKKNVKKVKLSAVKIRTGICAGTTDGRVIIKDGV
jgi:hypothetical protein